MVRAAEAAGLREICFTDHMDAKISGPEKSIYTQEEYEKNYATLRSSTVKLRFGMEFGLTPDNYPRFLEETAKRTYDFIIGSIHCVNGKCIFFDEYWEEKLPEQAYIEYLEEAIRCLRVHDGFHVLGHMTCPTKVYQNSAHKVYSLKEYGDYAEEIFRLLIDKGIGLEVNTSGIKVGGQPLPPFEFVKRYVEMGGEILTVGSDAHTPEQVGAYIAPVLEQLQEIIPWICTFAEGKPVFHRISDLCNAR